MAQDTAVIFSKGNEAFVDENYDLAIKFYSEAIKIESENANYYLKRCNAYIKQENYSDAVNDANQSLKCNPNDGRAYQKLGYSLFHLERFEEALDAYKNALAFQESCDQIKQWIGKCEAEIDLVDTTNTEEMYVGISELHKRQSDEKSVKTEASSKEIRMPEPSKAKYDWYQTETHIIISLLIKNITHEKVQCEFTEKILSVTVKLPNGNDYSLELDLAHNIVANASSYKTLKTKIEIKLKKEKGLRWSELEDQHLPSNTVVKTIPTNTTSNGASIVHKYPSSSHSCKNWDRLAKEVEEEETNENKEGDGALNALFQKIYADGNDEVKKAMNKSFQESGGTVLSTNWGEISKEKVEVKPPDCMEYKKYEY